jgi:hypothetical protein
MKFTGQTSKDGVLDNLLRAYVSRPSNRHKSCTEFDTDQANAYIERRLTGSMRSQYEQHLSGCTGCRKNVIGLMRLAETDAMATVPARKVSQSTWFENIQQAFGVLARPQWALAAAAIVVLGISIPLILSLNRNQSEIPSIAQNQTSNTPEAAGTAGKPATLASAKPSAEITPGDSIAQADEVRKREKPVDKFEAKPEVLSKNAQPVSSESASSAGFVAAADLSKKQGASAAAQSIEDARVKTESQIAQPRAQAPSSPGAQVGRNEAQQARQQQTVEKDSAQQVAESKTRADQESAGKEKAKSAEEAAAPPTPPADASRDRGLRGPASKLALRDPNTGEAVRLDERKISGKRFFFRSGTWTDKDYDPDKDLPIVTVIRDSNVYKELLSRRTGLKPIMEKFTAAERAIIVYKGTVYKLIPQ